MKTVTMAFAKSTKGTHVFTAYTDDDAIIPTLYIKKEAFTNGKAPSTIKVTITEGEK